MAETAPIFYSNVTRRRIFQLGGAVMLVPFAASIAGCGAAAVATPASMPLLDWVVSTSVGAFAAQTATDIAKPLPAAVANSLAYLKQEVSHPSSPKISIVYPAPVRNQLRSLVHAVHLDSDDHQLASSVHDVDGHDLLLIPSIVQLALNCLTLYSAGYRGQFFEHKPGKVPSAASMVALRKAHSIVAIKKTGGSERVDKACTWTTLTTGSQHIDVDWAPSRDALSDCALTVQRGQKPQGLPPIWNAQVTFSVPYLYVFQNPT